MNRAQRHTLFVLAALLVAGLAALTPAAAQDTGEIELAIEPNATGVEPGETQTYEVVVEGADSGISAYDGVVLNLSDPSVGDIVGFNEQFNESAGFTSSNSEIRNDNTTLYLEAVTGETFAAPGGEAVIATLDVQTAADAVGGDTTAVEFDTTATQSVADFDSVAPYNISGFQGASLTVSTLGADQITLAIEPGTAELQPGEVQTYEVVVEGADSGIGAYDGVVLNLSNPEVGDIVGFNEQFDESAGFTSSNSEIRNDNTTLYLEAVTGESFTDPGFETVIATFELTALPGANDGDTTALEFDTTAAQSVADFDSIEPYSIVEFREANASLSVEFPAALELSSVEAPEAVQITDSLEVDYTVENTGDSTGTESAVELVVDIVGPTVEDTDTDVTVGPGSSVDGTLVFDEFEGLGPGVTIDYTVQLADFGDSVSGSTTIAEGEPAAALSNLDIAGQGVDANITAGETESVSVDITNSGSIAAEFTMSMAVSTDGTDPIVEAEQSSPGVDPGETETVVFEEVTDQLGVGDYVVELVASSVGADDVVFGDLLVTEPASVPALSNLDIAGQGTEAVVTEGETEPVSVNITNAGAGAGSFEVAIDIIPEGGGRGTQTTISTDVLAPGETETVVFETVTGRLDVGAYTVELTAGGELVSGDLAVEKSQESESQLSNLDIDGQGSAATVVEGEAADVGVEVESVGDAAGAFDVALEISTVDGDPAGGSEQTTGTLAPGEAKTLVFEDVTGDLSPGGYTIDIVTDTDSVFGAMTVVDDGNDTSLLSDLNIAGQGTVATLLTGEDAAVTVDVTNVLESSDAFEITLQAGGGTGTTQTTDVLEPGGSETLTFTGVAGDLGTGQYDVVVTSGETQLTGSLTVTVGVDVTGDGNVASDTTGDGLLNDIDGDGEFAIFDVQALFNYFEDDIVTNSPELFNFDGATPPKMSIFDVQALFNQLG